MEYVGITNDITTFPAFDPLLWHALNQLNGVNIEFRDIELHQSDSLKRKKTHAAIAMYTKAQTITQL